MPHDRKGQLIQQGDRVRVGAHPVTLLQVESNPDYPGEYAPHVSARGMRQELEGEVLEVFASEEACNARFRFDGVQGEHTFNTRLVEKIEG